MSKLMIDPPGKDAPALVRALWMASGPGHAWLILKWARGIDKHDARYALAREAATKARAIRKDYAQGASEYATMRIDKLWGRLRGVMNERARTLKDAAKGGTASAKEKKELAIAQRRKIEPEAKRLLGLPSKLSDIGIATRLAPDTEIGLAKALTPGVLAVHIAKLRKDAKKK